MMGFLSGLFSDKKKVESNSNQTGQQSYGLSDEAKNYWSTVAPTFNQGWTPVANDPSQIAAAGAQAGLSSGLNPAFSTATGIGASGISTADIQRFQNPYEDQVVRDTLDDMRYADSQALSQSNAAAAKAGALGGTSGIVRRNLLEDNFQDARNKAVTGIRQAGFNTAADLATKSTQAQLAGVGAASGIAGQQSGINQTQFGMGTQGWNQAWQNANQPFTVAGQGAQVLAGLSPASGQSTSGTSTGTQTTTATPSLFSVGANLAGAAFAGGWRPFAANGGRIEMADGGAVDGDAPQDQKDPHAKFKSAFDAISGMLERARGGSVSGMAPMRSAGGPAIGPFTTTVHPATPSPSFDMNAFGQGLSKMGESKQDSGGDDTALLQQQQQALSSMLSGMSGRRAAGGGVWDETGPEFGGSSGISPPARLGAAPERVERRPLAPPRSTWTGEDEVWQGLRAPQRAAAMGLLEADGRDPVAARNAISAMINRSNRTGEDLGDHVSRAIYQPTIEPAQRARLRSVVASPAFKEMTSFAEDRIYNRVPDPVGGNTHFLAHEPVMERLTAREPGKYRSWPGWTGYAKGGGQYSNPDGSPVIRDKSHAFLSPEGRFDGGDPARDLEENPGPMPPPAPSSTMVASSSARGPVRMASVEPTSSSGIPIATDAPKRGGWFNEGIWTGEKMTPMQRLGIGLMSVRGPMFGGPMNDMAKQLMGMEEGRLNEKRIDSQADQFAKQLAQTRDLAIGNVGGAKTLAREQYEGEVGFRKAQIEKLEAEARKLNAAENDPIARFIAERLKSLTTPSPSSEAPASRPGDGTPRVIPQSFEGGDAPKAEDGSDPNFIRTQAVIGDGPVAGPEKPLPGTRKVDTPLGQMTLDEARKLGGAMLVHPKYKALGEAIMSSITREEKAATAEGKVGNLSQSAMSEINKKEVNAAEGLARMSEISRMYDPKYQTWEEGLKNAGLAAWDSIGLLRDKMTDEQRASLTDFTKFKSTAVAALNDYVKEITGAAMSAGEAERIRKGVIDSERDGPTQFKAKLDQGMRLAQLALIRYSYSRNSGKPWNESGISLDQMERMVEDRTRALRAEILKANPGAKANEINSEVRTKLKQEFGI